MLRAKKFYFLTVSVVLFLGITGLVLRKARQEAPATLHEISARTNGSEVAEATRLAVETGYGKLPLSFEPNRGQSDPQVKFLSRAGDRTLWLTSDEAVLAVGRPSRAGASRAKQVVPAVLRMKFVGVNANPQIEGQGRQSGTVNYFFGKPDQWRTKIPTYTRVRYRSLYPGIDVVFYGNNRELEYDLVVSPGADPGRIRLDFQGAEKIRIDGEGNLVLKTAAGDLIQQKPKIYQRKGAKLTAVAGDYVITGKDEVGFRLGNYDRSGALVIDPVLRYSTFLGGNDFDQARGIGVDSSKRAVVGGITCSLSFPRTVGPTTFEGCSVFITKFDFTGSRLVFSTFIGESASDVFDVGAMALDSQGNSYVTGIVEFMGFPTTPGAFQPTLHGDFDAFVAKLSPDGSHLVYSTFLGGFAREEGDAITADSQGNAYVTGNTTSEDFPTTRGVFQPNCKFSAAGGCSTAFISKLSPDGSHLVWSTFLGGAEPAGSGSGGQGIAVDRRGNVLVTGGTSSSDFPTTAGSAQSVFPGGTPSVVTTASFVTKMSSSGSHLVYSTFLRLDDMGRAIAADASGNAFVASGNFLVANVGSVSKLSPNIGRLLYTRNLGGTGTGIAVTSDGKAYVAGVTSSSTFPTTQTAFQRVIGGGANTFLTKFDPTGHIIYSSYLGGSDTGVAEGMTPNGPVVALDSDTNAYIAGATQAGYPATPGAFQSKFAGGESDAFVAKVVSLCALSSVDRSVTICSPGDGSTVQSPVNIVAGATDVTPVKLTQIYLDGKKFYEAPLSAINVNMPIANGTHRLTVQAFDTNNVIFKKTIHMTVSSQTAPCALNPVNRTVTICSPSDGATVKSPVNVVAGTTDSTPVKLMQIYLDGKKVFEVKSASLNTSLAMAAGSHRLTVQAIDTANAIFKKTINITVQ